MLQHLPLRAARMRVHSLTPNLPNKDDTDDATGGGSGSEENAVRATGDISLGGALMGQGSTGMWTIGGSLTAKELQQAKRPAKRRDETDVVVNPEIGPLDDNPFILQERTKPHKNA